MYLWAYFIRYKNSRIKSSSPAFQKRVTSLWIAYFIDKAVFVADKHVHFSTNDMIAQQLADQTSQAQLPLMAKDEILWTPAFILFFALLFGLGMSIASLVSYIWVNSQLYPVDKIGTTYTVVLLGIWLIVLIRARSGGIRLGAAFGCTWALGMFGQFWLNSHSVGPQAAIMIEMSALSNSALLGNALCLSTARIQLRQWDTIFLWVLPVLFCGYLVYSYLRAPVDTHSLLFIEGKIASITIYLTIGVWWLRVGCWQDQAGPAFLFGLAAILWLAADKVGNITTELALFMLQLFFLCLILGAMRILQGERRLKKTAS